MNNNIIYVDFTAKKKENKSKSSFVKNIIQKICTLFKTSNGSTKNFNSARKIL